MINKVTITGADDNTSISKMIELSQKYSFVEWGILFSPKRVGTDKYPGHGWIKLLQTATIRKKLNFSAHLCGQYTAEMLNGNFNYVINDIGKFSNLFNRYQLNFNAQHITISQEFYTYLASADATFILQFNNDNMPVCEKIINKYRLNNVNFLYDSSGGRGIMADKYDAPIKNHYTGYSGGLTPSNIEEALQKIKKVTASNPHIWIDVETGVRTNGRLDMHKVECFLETCAKYVTVGPYTTNHNAKHIDSGKRDANIYASEFGLPTMPLQELKYLCTRFAFECRKKGVIINSETCDLFDEWIKTQLITKPSL